MEIDDSLTEHTMTIAHIALTSTVLRGSKESAMLAVAIETGVSVTLALVTMVILWTAPLFIHSQETYRNNRGCLISELPSFKGKFWHFLTITHCFPPSVRIHSFYNDGGEYNVTLTHGNIGQNYNETTHVVKNLI